MKTSTVLSTQIYPDDNCIVGFYKAVNTYEQQITWGQYNNVSQPFSLTSINVYCECKFYDKETKLSGKCCRHITGQLRRAVFFSSLLQTTFLLVQVHFKYISCLVIYYWLSLSFFLVKVKN